MKISWLCDFNFTKPLSGLEIPAYYLTKNLEKKGIDINKVVVKKPDSSCVEEIIRNSDVVVMDYFSNKRVESYLYRHLRKKRILLSFLRDSRLINSFSLFKFSSLSFSKKITNLFFSAAKDLITSFRQYDGLIFVNERDALIFSKLFPWTTKKCFVVKNGVDINKYYPSHFGKKEKKELLFVGPSSYTPNREAVHYIVKYIIPLFLQYPEIEFRIVGKGWKQINEYKNLPKMKVDDFVEDLASIYRNSWAFISPLFIGSGIKNKTLEAMASGLPVLGTSETFSGIPVIDRKHCFICRTPADFKNAIAELIQNPNLYKSIAFNARSLMVNEFSWDKSAEKLLEIIMRLTKEK